MNILSIFGGGLFIIPLLLFGGAAFFGYRGYKASKSGSTVQTKDGIQDSDIDVPFYKTGYGIFSIILFVAFIVVVLAMCGDR